VVDYERYDLPDIDVYTGDLKAAIHGQVRRVLETTSFGYRDLLGGSKELRNMRLRARRRMGDSSGVFSRS
jgi:hypothetical protein